VRAQLRWAVWWLALTLWTVALVTPQPVELGKQILPSGADFPVGKTLHVVAYALLTAALAWLPARPRWRAVLVLGLFLHAGLTEYVQTFVEGRSGSLSDVGLDSLGIMLGLALGWRRWKQ
jgi:VanZ family protein